MVKIKNHAAMTALLNGTAKKYEMGVLTTMSNIVEALWELGFGAEYQNASCPYPAWPFGTVDPKELAKWSRKNITTKPATDDYEPALF